VGEITALAGCDRLTISPNLLDEMDAMTGTLERKLSADNITSVDPIKMDENTFRWMMNEDAMATEKLAQGIRGSPRTSLTTDLKLPCSTERGR